MTLGQTNVVISVTESIAAYLRLVNRTNTCDCLNCMGFELIILQTLQTKAPLPYGIKLHTGLTGFQISLQQRVGQMISNSAFTDLCHKVKLVALIRFFFYTLNKIALLDKSALGAN